MAIAVVQTLADPASINTDTQGLTLTSNVTAGNAIICLTAYLDGSNNADYPALPTSSLGTFAADVQQATASHDSSNIYSTWSSAGGSKTVTNNKNSATTSGQANWTSQLMEVSGVSATDEAYAIQTSSGNTTGPVTVTTSASVNAHDLVVAMFEVNATESGLAIPSGWTPIGSTGLGGGDYPSAGFAYIIPSSSGFVTANFGSMASGTNWSIVIVAYPAYSVPLGYTLTAAFGSYALTGEAASFSISNALPLTLLANPGTYNLVGALSQSQTGFSVSYGTYVLTGENATLVNSTGAAFSLACAYGSFALTGEAANLQPFTYSFQAFTGYFVLTGENLAFVSGAPAGYEFLPNYVGMDWLEASLVLYQGGYAEINPVIIRMKGLNQASQKGIVVGQTPIANALVKPGTAVQLSVNSDSLLSVAFEA